MLRVALYARYSSDQQREASIEDQLRPCRLYAEKQGWVVAESYHDRAVSDGWAPWPWDAIQFFREHGAGHLWEVAALALYTGQRMSDVLVMRWSDINEGLIACTQAKTTKKLWIPIHKQLRLLLAPLEARLRTKLGKAGKDLDIRRHHEPILLNTRSSPWTPDGFKASWAKELNAPRMAEFRSRRLVFHGLRKSAVIFLLEAGCSDAETAAITGQSRNIVEHYAKQVNQRPPCGRRHPQMGGRRRGPCGQAQEEEEGRVCTTGSGICTTAASLAG